MIVLLLLLAVVVADRERPVIGILTQPIDSAFVGMGKSYIAASYVKYIESAGARVVPVFHNSSIAEIDRVYSQIDGILFPGGDADLGPTTPIFKTASRIYNHAILDMNNGVQFTIFGHCMGFELLNLLTSRNPNLLQRFDASNISLTLDVTPKAATSRLFSSGNTARAAEAFDILTTQAVTYNSHEYGVSPRSYTPGSALDQFYDVLSTNNDRNGRPFVSTIEAKKYAIYGLQWHPEKASFEWDSQLTINHNATSVVANNHMARFFVESCRESPHVLTDKSLLIYNFDKTLRYTGTISSFEECYIFK